MKQQSARFQYILSVILYGMIGTLLRFTNVPSEFAAFCRGVIGSLTILAILALRKKAIGVSALKAQWKLLLISGLCLGLNWVFLFAAYKTISVAIASLCNYLAPVIVLAISPFVFKTRLNGKQIACVLAALLGIILISGVTDSSPADLNLKGLALGLASAVCFVGIILCNRFFKDMDSLDKTFSQLAIASVVMLPFVLFGGISSVQPDLRSVLILALIGILNTGVAYVFYFNGIASISLQSVAVLGYLEPVESVLLSAVVLHEPLTPAGIVGAVLIIGAALCSELL